MERHKKSGAKKSQEKNTKKDQVEIYKRQKVE